MRWAAHHSVICSDQGPCAKMCACCAGNAAKDAGDNQESGPSVPKEVVVPPEEPGTGTNEFTYWVSTSPSGSFFKLPHVLPLQIVASRGIQKIFTGMRTFFFVLVVYSRMRLPFVIDSFARSLDYATAAAGNLDAEVKAAMPFLGHEKHLLRAVIANIAADTVLCPKGYYIIDEESEEVQLNEEYECPENLKAPDSWIHKNSSILPQVPRSFLCICFSFYLSQNPVANSVPKLGCQYLHFL